MNIKLQRFNVTTLVIFSHLSEHSPFDISPFFHELHSEVNHYFSEEDQEKNDDYILQVIMKLREFGYIRYEGIADKHVLNMGFTRPGHERFDHDISSLNIAKEQSETSSLSYTNLIQSVLSGVISNLIVKQI